MFCVNESLKTIMSAVSGLGGERSWAGASHPFGEVMTGTTTLTRPKTINKKHSKIRC